ncbi:hypothetical protein ACH4SK_32760 [Streptomyces inhibens]|uniref:hypothetical protein n=1 Tax=Streptomyces inhibens TaxID=2293571 RepID=UPI0037BAEF55
MTAQTRTKDRTGPYPRERIVMPHPSVLLAAVQEASRADGPGWILRTVIVVGVVGAVLLAWFLLRGYGQD